MSRRRVTEAQYQSWCHKLGRLSMEITRVACMRNDPQLWDELLLVDHETTDDTITMRHAMYVQP